MNLIHISYFTIKYKFTTVRDLTMSLSFLNDEEDVQQKGCTLIDLSQITLATIMATYEEGDKINVEQMRHLVLSTLKFNALKFKKEGYTEIFICVDNAKKGYWRKSVASYYKANRSISREANEWDWEGIFNGLHTVVDEISENLPYYVINVDHAEADDGIAVLTEYFSKLNYKIMIVSSDGDFTQLHKFPNVRQWSPIQKKFVVPKIDPYMDKLIKVVKGDKKDNVASIKVRGDFHTTKQPGERSPSVYKKELDALSLLLTDEEIKSVLPEDQWNRFKENRILIDFDYIDENIKQEILKCYTEYKLPKRNKIYSYFVKNGLVKLINEINNF